MNVDGRNVSMVIFLNDKTHTSEGIPVNGAIKQLLASRDDPAPAKAAAASFPGRRCICMIPKP